MDQAITRWINALAGSNVLLDSFMIAATQFVVPLFVLPVALQWWSRRERVHVRHTCMAAGLSFLIGLGLNQIILLYVHRIRPYDAGLSHLIINRSGDWSFPSDHATATFAIAASFLLHGMRKRAPSWCLADFRVAGLCRNALCHRRARRSRHGDHRRCRCPLALLGRHEGGSPHHQNLVGLGNRSSHCGI
jgi:undecaprenyl-diphosphatase